MLRLWKALHRRGEDRHRARPDPLSTLLVVPAAAPEAEAARWGSESAVPQLPSECGCSVLRPVLLADTHGALQGGV